MIDRTKQGICFDLTVRHFTVSVCLSVRLTIVRPHALPILMQFVINVLGTNKGEAKYV